MVGGRSDDSPLHRHVLVERQAVVAGEQSLVVADSRWAQEAAPQIDLTACPGADARGQVSLR